LLNLSFSSVEYGIFINPYITGVIQMFKPCNRDILTVIHTSCIIIVSAVTTITLHSITPKSLPTFTTSSQEIALALITRYSSSRFTARLRLNKDGGGMVAAEEAQKQKENNEGIVERYGKNLCSPPAVIP